MNELSVALIGCGDKGFAHLESWVGVSGVKLKAIYDADGLVVAAAARECAGAAAFTDVAALLASGEYDIVDVCTPADTHEQYAVAALRAGANVICELPVSGDPARCANIAQAATQRERLFMPAFSYRLDSFVAFAENLIQNDDIGLPVMYRCRFSGKAPIDPMHDAHAQRGALLQIGIQGIDLFRYLCGETVSITAEIGARDPTHGAEQCAEQRAAVLLRSQSGAIGVVEIDSNVTAGRNVIEIYGTAGACLIDYDIGVLRYLTADHPVWRTRDGGGPNRIANLLAHFADAVRGIQPAVCTSDDGVRALTICADLYGSAGA